jgi:hypothetical protein
VCTNFIVVMINFLFQESLLMFTHLVIGHFCLALSKAVKTMKKGEKAILTVKPQCKLSTKHFGKDLFACVLVFKNYFIILL